MCRAAAAVLLLCGGLPGQTPVTLDDSRIRAVLREEKTAIVIPVVNESGKEIHAHLTLEWLDRTDAVRGTVQREVVIPPGSSDLEASLPLTESSIWTRLRYALAPTAADARAFARRESVLSLPHIAGHAFALTASRAGTPRRGDAITVHAAAVHPVSRLPVAGVLWEAKLAVDGKKVAPQRSAMPGEGLAEFTFAIPSGGDDPDDEASIEISARLGDFERSITLDLELPRRLSARIQTDKPIYQPGQVLHMRAVVMDAQGRAAAGTKVTLRIHDDDGERAHTAQLTASKFGVIQDDWTLPASARLGEYKITLEAGEDDRMDGIARHSVRVSRYELPAFRVEVKPDRTAYLPGQPAAVTVTGTYLFGKPVPKGRVKIVRNPDARFNARSRKWETEQEVVAEGEAQEDGTFRAAVDLRAGHEELQRLSADQRYVDARFTAYYTDAASGRTEPRRFALRLSREPVHVYLILPEDGAGLPAPAYVSASYADGRPAVANVELSWSGGSVRARTNRYGVARAMLPASIPHGAMLRVKAEDETGQSGIWEDYYTAGPGAPLRIETSRTLHRSGQDVRLQITASPGSPPEQMLVVHALAEGRRVATRFVRLSNDRADVTFSYQPEFRRTVAFMAWSAAGCRGESRRCGAPARAVIFPDGSDLKLEVLPDRTMYQPAANATLRLRASALDGKPVEAAIGLAVVDQAVIERARTDSEFGSRRWFGCAYCGDSGETELGGVRLNDLYAWKQESPITPELDLVAEVLVARTGGLLALELSESLHEAPEFSAIKAQMARLKSILDRHYADRLEFPEDGTALSAALGTEWSNLADPWGRTYTARFGVDRDERTIEVLSAGPDRQFGSEDDFIAGTFRRSYFGPLSRLMEDALRRQADYPATAEEFTALLRESGLLLEALRDPWGMAYRVEVRTYGIFRFIQILSAGADRRFGTGDDFPVRAFRGTYFRKEAEEMGRAVRSAAKQPRSLEEFRLVLAGAGIDVARYKDAWGRPYRLASEASSQRADRHQTTIRQVYGSTPNMVTEAIPLTQHFIWFLIRSDGPDGEPETYDDFSIARIAVLLSEEGAPEDASGRAHSLPLTGSGSVMGTVTDPAGAVIPNVQIALSDASGASYYATSNEEGAFRLAGVAAGRYLLRASAPGFMPYEVMEIPVSEGKTTQVDLCLKVGELSETVTVEAAPAMVETLSAATMAVQPVATPRVRDYFPETLVWLPEILTDASGNAVSRFAVADSVTTWKAAAFASTVDGRMAETEAEFKTFQPFFVDLYPPSVLTDRDQIELPATVRNYQKQAQAVIVAAQPNAQLMVAGKASKRVDVPANGSVNVAFTLQAKGAADRVALRARADAGRTGDAVEKTLRLRPDGQEVVQTRGDVFAGRAEMKVTIPEASIPGATRSELRVYPNLTALLLESAAALLHLPRGCAEQMISTGYAHLISWRFAHASGIQDPLLEKRLLANVRMAADLVMALQTGQGGIPYWAGGEPDIGVSAYALSFLAEASKVTAVDPDNLRLLVTWLEKKQTTDGRWLRAGVQPGSPDAQSLLLTGTVARGLASASKAGITVPEKMLGAAYHHLARFTDQTDEPYLLATFLLAALDSGHESLAGTAAARLLALGREEAGGLYWDLRTNTPFYGWGAAGRYETTGLVVSALAAWRARHPELPIFDGYIRRGLVFLVRRRDARGAWHSTQATLCAMRAVEDASGVVGLLAGHGGAMEVRVNDRPATVLPLPNDKHASDPLILDLSAFLVPGENRISLAGTGDAGSVLIRLTSSHWLPWDQTSARRSAELRYEVRFDTLQAKTGDPVRCSVTAERVGFRGYGMMLAEVGLPPGAEVDRGSLEQVLADHAQGVRQYEIHPDRVVFYLWPRAGGSAFEFLMSMRYPMSAKSGASVLYDYYNPEVLSEQPPLRWSIR